MAECNENNEKSKRDEKFANLTENDDFAKWFWEKSNGNNFIKYLNKKRGNGDIVRREKWKPYVYGVVVNSHNDENVKLVKIGFTQQDTKPDSGNRMENVRKEIIDSLKISENKVSILFVLMKNPVDTTKHSEFENNIRKKWGVPAKGDYVKKTWELPIHTEWVLTTQTHIDKMKKLIEDEKKKGEIDASIFKDLDTFKKESLSDNYLKHCKE